MRNHTILPNPPRELHNTPLGDWCNRVRQAFDALTDTNGVVSGGSVSGSYFVLDEDNSASGNNTFTGTNIFEGWTQFGGTVTFPVSALDLSERALNCTGARVLGKVDVGGLTVDGDSSTDNMAVCWASLSVQAWAVADGLDPLDPDYLGIHTGMPVCLDHATLATGFEGDAVPTAYRATASILGRPPSGLWVGDVSPMGDEMGAAVRKGLVQAKDWTQVLDDASALLEPGACYFVSPGTGAGSGRLTLTPGPWCVGVAVTQLLLFVDVDFHWGLGGVTWAKHATDPILAGQPATLAASAWTLAQADDHATAAHAVALRDGDADTWVPFAARAEVCRDDWTSVSGSPDLTPSATYWLSQVVAGLLTDTAPAATGGTTCLQVVGRALTERRLLVDLQPVVQTPESDASGPVAYDPADGGQFRRVAAGAGASSTHYDGGAAATVYGPASTTIDGGGA